MNHHSNVPHKRHRRLFRRDHWAAIEAVLNEWNRTMDEQVNPHAELEERLVALFEADNPDFVPRDFYEHVEG